MSEKKKIELGRKIKELGKAVMSIEPATVKSVNEEELTCVVELLNETEIPNVRLKAAIDGETDGIVQIPEVNSTVLVAMIGNDINTRFVAAFSKVTETLFYDGSNGGLMKIENVVEKLNNLENKVNDIITAYLAHTHPVSGGSTLVPSGSPIMPLVTTNRNELENTKVKH